MKFAYKLKVDKSENEKKSRWNKDYYDMRVRESKLEVGDRVLVRNVRSRSKLDDRWEEGTFMLSLVSQIYKFPFTRSERKRMTLNGVYCTGICYFRSAISLVLIVQKILRSIPQSSIGNLFQGRNRRSLIILPIRHLDLKNCMLSRPDAGYKTISVITPGHSKVPALVVLVVHKAQSLPIILVVCPNLPNRLRLTVKDHLK